MKKLVFTIICILSSYSLFAQDTPPAPKVDSTSLDKPRKIPKSDLKVIEGTTMIPATDINGNILHTKNLSWFYSVIKKAGLVETIRSKGPITVFAPNDEALTKLPPGKIDTLLQAQHKYELIALITYHALPGKVTSGDISKQINAGKGKAVLTTLTGSILTASFDQNKDIVLTDENGGKSTVKRANLESNNGLIHLVDAVLVPKFKII